MSESAITHDCFHVASKHGMLAVRMSVPEAITRIEAQLRRASEDDPSWEVYADYLLERGDPRGELIRLQRRAAGREDPALARSIAELFTAHVEAWTPSAHGLDIEHDWRHGFVSSMRVKGLTSAEHMEALGRVLGDPQARMLTALSLCFGPTATPALPEQLDAFDLSGLLELRASYCRIGNAVVGALVRQPTLSLHTLDLRRSWLGDDALARLVRGPTLRGLRRLYLRDNAITGKGIEALSAAAALDSLELLDLRDNAIELGGVRALANSSVLGRLQTLQLQGCGLNWNGKKALAESMTLPRHITAYWGADP
jgi:uncharacterized protein (TIGR02996 family)